MATATPTLIAGHQGPAQESSPDVITKLTILMSSSYSTGGDLVDHELAANGGIAIAEVKHVFFGLGWGGYTPIWDRANKKVIVERTDAVDVPRVEETAAVDVGAVVTAGEMFIWHS